jgi:transcriptional regulator with XRE-family HTH domain
VPPASESWSEEARLLAGDRLRRTRVQQRLSIRQIAELSKISKTSVVQVESGRSSRRSTYLKVAEAMGLHLDRLLQPDATEERPYAVHRRQDDAWFDMVDFGNGPLPEAAQKDPEARRALSVRSGIAPLNILTSRLERGRIKPTVLELYESSPVRSHAGEEHVFVLEGEAIVTVGGAEISLSTGEAVTFWSSEPHSYAPQSGSHLPVRLLSVRVDS